MQREGAFISQCAVALDGPLDHEVLRKALRMAVSRHEILRTSFHSLAGMKFPVQVIAEDVFEPELREHAVHEFDLKRAPLIGFALLKHAADKHVLVITQPSLCGDAESLAQLVVKLSRYYAACASGEGVSEEPVQHVDFSEWQHELAGAAESEPQRQYWRKQLETARTATPLSLPLKNRQADGSNDLSLSFSIANGKEIEALARELNTSVEIVLSSCWQILLSRLTEQPDVVIGQFSDGRRIKHLRECLGPLGEFLPLHTRIDKASRFSDVVRHSHDAAKANRANQEYFTAGQNSEDAIPLPVKFEFTTWPDAQTAAGVRFSLTNVYSTTDRFELKLSIVSRDSSFACELHFDETKYAPQMVERVASEFKTLLQSAVENPESLVSELELLSDEERRQLLFEWNGNTAEYRRDVCLHELFEEQVQRTPEAPAVVFRDQQLSFAELNSRANQLARYLRQLGVGPEVRTALCMERSVEMVVGMLAILKAGGVYVPLDMAQPQARLKFMLEDADARVVLTQQALVDLLPKHDVPIVCVDECVLDENADNLPTNATADNLAYVIYTSGSTGTPKGVMVGHRSAVNLVSGLRQAIYDNHSTPLRVSVNAQIVFDASIKQLVQLLGGHTLVVIPEDVRASGEAMLAHIAEQRLDVLDCTPSQLQLLLASEAWQHDKPKALLIGGEAISADLWDRLATLAVQSGTECYNVYGPTECTVDAAIGQVETAGETPNIGHPITNARIYLLDAQQRPVPIGVRGEICVAGECLARGYLNASGLTAEKFVPEPFSGVAGARMYRTGDLGRYLADGRIEFVGRVDHQVKVRGVRIELGEIEAVLRQHEAVRDAVVQVSQGMAGDTRLVAYVAVDRKYLPIVDGRARYQLPNGLAVLHQNKNETDYLYQEIFENRTYVKHGIKLPDGACVIDVGANIGLFTLFVLEHCRDARVFAFEPIEPIFETLKLNVELYGEKVRLFPYGLSDKTSAASFTFYPHYSMMSGLSDYARAGDDVEVVKRYLLNQQREGAAGAGSLLEHADEFLSERFVGQVYQSQLRTLSDFLRSEKLERIDLLKIDVQRAELDVLNGIDEDDWARIQQIVMEAHDADGEADNSRLKEISTLLERHGFKVTAEQDETLSGTDRYNVYASRNGTQKQQSTVTRAESTRIVQLATPSDLRKRLKSQLPESMIPSAFVILEKLPLTRNGKVDRAALAALESRHTADNATYVAPQNQMEQIVARIWQEALRVERVGIHDNFFELGGHSLLMAQVHNRLVTTLNREISMVEMFQHPTVSTLAKRLSEDGPRSRSLQSVQERAARQKEAMDHQQAKARKAGTAV